jgi:hypothetical protein
MVPGLYVIPEIGWMLNCDSDIATVIFQISLKVFDYAREVEASSLNELFDLRSEVKVQINSSNQYFDLDEKSTFEIYDRAFSRGLFLRKKEAYSKKYPFLK